MFAFPSLLQGEAYFFPLFCNTSLSPLLRLQTRAKAFLSCSFFVSREISACQRKTGRHGVGFANKFFLLPHWILVKLQYIVVTIFILFLLP